MLPSFSIIIETETLSESGVEELSPCLKSLANQSVAPNIANEILLLNSGELHNDLIDNLKNEYPWILIQSIAPEATLYSAKMDGAEMVTGSIVIFWDADCVYSPSWIENVLTILAKQPTVQLVAGETSMEVHGIYDLAMAITHIFPRYTNQHAPYITEGYYANNVAFRRQFLLKNPIPLKMPFNRGHCYIHAYNLRKMGIQIWKHPKAKAKHSITKEAHFFFFRFLTMGYEFLETRKVAYAITNNGGQPISRISWLSVELAVQVAFRKCLDMFRKTLKIFKETPINILLFPFAAPLILVGIFLFWSGIGLSFIYPKYLLANSKSH